MSLITDNVLTDLNSLASASPSASAVYSKLDSASFKTNQASPITIWMQGYLTPQRTSAYLFELSTNGAANLFISSDQSSANKKLIATSAADSSGTVDLIAGQYYYFKVIGSRSGSLNLKVNAQMFTTTLTDSVSGNVQNDIQQIQINSTIVPETYVSYKFFNLSFLYVLYSDFSF